MQITIGAGLFPGGPGYPESGEAARKPGARPDKGFGLHYEQKTTAPTDLHDTQEGGETPAETGSGADLGDTASDTSQAAQGTDRSDVPDESVSAGQQAIESAVAPAGPGEIVTPQMVIPSTAQAQNIQANGSADLAASPKTPGVVDITPPDIRQAAPVKPDAAMVLAPAPVTLAPRPRPGDAGAQDMPHGQTAGPARLAAPTPSAEAPSAPPALPPSTSQTDQTRIADLHATSPTPAQSGVPGLYSAGSWTRDSKHAQTGTPQMPHPDGTLRQVSTPSPVGLRQPRPAGSDMPPNQQTPEATPLDPKDAARNDLAGRLARVDRTPGTMPDAISDTRPMTGTPVMPRATPLDGLPGLAASGAVPGPVLHTGPAPDPMRRAITTATVQPSNAKPETPAHVPVPEAAQTAPLRSRRGVQPGQNPPAAPTSPIQPGPFAAAASAIGGLSGAPSPLAGGLDDVDGAINGDAGRVLTAGEIDFAATGPGPGLSRAPAADPAAPQPGHLRVPPAHVAEALARQPERALEITLTPEEMGRVRFTLVTGDSGTTIVINTERPDSLDLIRRYAQDLVDEFRRQGFGTVDLEFQDRTRHQRQGPPEILSTGPDAAHDSTAPVPENTAPRPPVRTTGLDLRI